MKPKIIYWTYLALGYVLLNNALSIVFYFETGESALLYLTPPIIIASIVAIIGLIKKVSWSRIVAIIVIVIQASSTIIASIHFVVDTESSIADMLMSSIIVDLLILFLAYRLYSSVPLKDYLIASRVPH